MNSYRSSFVLAGIAIKVARAMASGRECRIGALPPGDVKIPYILAALEAFANCSNYHESEDCRRTSTQIERWHDVYSGKLAEFEFMRQLQNAGYSVTEGVRLFGRNHDGDLFDLKAVRDDAVRDDAARSFQVKFCRDGIFRATANDLARYRDAGVEIVCVTCCGGTFSADTEPPAGPGYGWRSNWFFPSRRHSFNCFAVDADAALARGVCSFRLREDAFAKDGPRSGLVRFF